MPAPTTFRATHAEGTIVKDTIEKIKTQKGRGFRLRIKNTGTTGMGVLGVSFDGGKIFYPIGLDAELAEDIVFHEFHITATGNNTDYSALIFEG